MNFDRALNALEYKSVIDLLVSKAITQGGKKICSELLPKTDISEVSILLENTDDAFRYILKGGEPPIAPVTDIVNSVKRAQSGGILSTAEFLEIAKVLKVTRNLCTYFEDYSFDSSLNEYISLLMPNKYLEEKIFSIILGVDEIADNASQTLFDIRRKIRITSQKIKDSLQKITHSPATQKYLQEPIVTVRSERYVIPVKAEYRSEIAGLVHDTSASGATLFIEPMSVVEANNDIKMLVQKEKDEIERILYELSAETATFEESIITNYESVIFIDYVFAKAKLAKKQNAVKPLLNNEGKIDLKKARHPLIDAKKVVPIDISLGIDYSTLVITGPNTGGKTVALKTLGILTLMAQSGLLIPAQDKSCISVFESVFADIGDEQSISQSLSTFSSHMTYIVEIVKAANSSSLVLFDELGAGTDPIEGAALAISILEYLANFGVKLVATTHYPELKLYALETKGVKNASCEFDIETLKPTYRLITGIPGRSNAFAIASRLGLEPSIIDKANEFISDENSRFEDVIDNLEKSRKKLESESQIAQKQREETDKMLINAKKLREELDEKARLEREKLQEELEILIQTSKEEIQRRIDELEQIRRKKDAKNFAENINKAKAKSSSTLSSLENSIPDIKQKSKQKPKLTRPLQIGDSVKLQNIDTPATVLELPDKNGKVLVQAGILKTRIKLEELTLIEEKKTSEKSTVTINKSLSSRSVSSELDIRGYNALEAEDEVLKFIDNAVVSGLQTVSIIHGKGTGVLRSAVHSMLKKNKCVRTFRLGVFGEGETGVTIVELR
ncbi:MAG: endonuclease MutS2 [Ruminococcaceae bacterium]|nr:endonuclease MutS2 [Oscillospiraceae bacterium]